jgi:CDP-glucose 4,6-dehydratase
VDVGAGAVEALVSGSALVTGGHGFVASWLSRALLERGDRVTVLDRGRPGRSGLELQGIAGEVALVEADLRDASKVRVALAGRDLDTVFHLAAQTIVGSARAAPAETFETNVRGTWILLEACREAGVSRVVVASSDKAYGAQAELPYREDVPLRASHPYEASKAAADIIARSYWASYGLPVAVTRLANVYGGGDLNFSRLVPEAVAAALDGRRPVIRSDGSPERDFLYVEDAARAYLAIAEALDRDGLARGEAFNAGGERPHSVAEVVRLIGEIAGIEVEPDIRGRGSPEGEIDRQFVDASKLRRATGWRARIDLREGLGRTLAWYREHPEARPEALAD